MYDRVLHNRWSKLATAVAGAVLMAVAINLVHRAAGALYRRPARIVSGDPNAAGDEARRHGEFRHCGPDLSCEQRAAAASGI